MGDDEEEIYGRVQKARAAIEDLRRTSKMSDELYYKSLIILAYEYVVANMIEEAAAYIMEIPSVYFGADSNAQMLADVHFHEKAAVVAEALMNHGYFLTQNAKALKYVD